jgi:hypothetical protein
VNESTRLNQLRNKTPGNAPRALVPVPCVSGVLAFAVSVLSFMVGRAQNETILLLLAFMLFTPLAYSFSALLVLSMLHRRKITGLKTRIAPAQIIAGGETALFLETINSETCMMTQGISVKPKDNAVKTTYSSKAFFQFPAILIRYKLYLATKDNKKITLILGKDFFAGGRSAIHIPLRGAYFGTEDEVAMFDVFGFFVFTYRISCGDQARICASPSLTNAAPLITHFSGGVNRRTENQIIKTDDLIEQRPYIPGDDPRRINWKLYGHSGGLFIREEDKEPPPHTQFVMIICAEADSALYRPSAEAGYENAVPGAAETDALCETALAIAAACAKDGINVFTGCPGIEFSNEDPGSAAEILAFPYSAPKPLTEPLPAVPPNIEEEIVILALPAICNDVTGALDRYITQKSALRKITVLFIYNDEKLAGPAEASAFLYGRIEGVHAKAIRV